MKNNINKSTKTGNRKGNTSKETNNADKNKKSTVAVLDQPPVTANVRTRHRIGHGMNNEGTNVDYEEQR